MRLDKYPTKVFDKFATQYTAAQAFVYLNNYAVYQWELWEAQFEH